MDLVLLVLLVAGFTAQGYIALKMRERFRFIDRQFDTVNRRFTWHEKKNENDKLEIQNISALSALKLNWPLFFGGWSVDGFMCRFLLQYLMENRPKNIVELGSGSSTILISRCLEILKEDTSFHVAIDHENRYLQQTQEQARLNGLEDRITFLECPLERYEAFDKLWYGGVIDKLKGEKIDLLIIDGPPGPLQSHSRYPAVPLLYELLAPHCTIVLDDAGRPDEREIVKQWVEEFPDFEMSLYPEGHGIAVLSR
ncbi:class I SAM-dependent methyltransferase [Desulfobacter postgatei]|jgi:predicted O-methyltransferase YrrM|uniref:O-methyltransferase n=1 Tax=Desulfobacter postgatei TaxID=2293 RepID=UPI002A35C462|nr:class I SAM-dependent methyltransferase [Desulfobacter postgatei]MDX9964230.1 class I SAM-dependent methyltransferase [Desulfobacter postgatei]